MTRIRIQQQHTRCSRNTKRGSGREGLAVARAPATSRPLHVSPSTLSAFHSTTRALPLQVRTPRPPSSLSVSDLLCRLPPDIVSVTVSHLPPRLHPASPACSAPSPACCSLFAPPQLRAHSAIPCLPDHTESPPTHRLHVFALRPPSTASDRLLLVTSLPPLKPPRSRPTARPALGCRAPPPPHPPPTPALTAR